MDKVKTVWLNNIPEKDRENFKQRILGSKDIFAVLLKILHDEYRTIERKGFKEEDYRSMDWTHVQAFNNGRLASIQKIAELINFEGD